MGKMISRAVGMDLPIAVASEWRTILSEPLSKYSPQIRAKSLRGKRGQFCPRADAHSTYGTAPREVLGRPCSIAADCREQVMLAQELPERSAVLLHCECGMGDVPVVLTQNCREKVVLESPNYTGFHRSE